MTPAELEREATRLLNAAGYDARGLRNEPDDYPAPSERRGHLAPKHLAK